MSGEITEVVSQAQAHLLGLVIRGEVTLPNVTAGQAEALLTGLNVKALPERSDTDTTFSAGAQRTTTATQPGKASTLGRVAVAAAAGGILAASRHQAPTPATPSPRPTQPAPIEAFTPPPVAPKHKRHAKPPRLGRGRV